MCGRFLFFFVVEVLAIQNAVADTRELLESGYSYWSYWKGRQNTTLPKTLDGFLNSRIGITFPFHGLTSFYRRLGESQDPLVRKFLRSRWVWGFKGNFLIEDENSYELLSALVRTATEPERKQIVRVLFLTPANPLINGIKNGIKNAMIGTGRITFTGLAVERAATHTHFISSLIKSDPTHFLFISGAMAAFDFGFKILYILPLLIPTSQNSTGEFSRRESYGATFRIKMAAQIKDPEERKIYLETGKRYPLKTRMKSICREILSLIPRF
ncbi:MAG: hypothetical protein JWQ35_291 [Bacteriovoracaceae bacterium]|nr:hypothetical protein [Bacteriovoracaceae bacterium]